MKTPRSAGRPRTNARAPDPNDASLLDIVDHVLTKGVVLTGDLVLGVADIDLVYVRLSAVLCAADRVLGPSAKKRRSGENKSVAAKLGAPRLTRRR